MHYNNQSNILAVFDLDGTITFKDTFLEFIKFFKGRANFYLGIMYLAPFIIGYYLTLYKNYELKEIFFTYFFKGTGMNQVDEKGKAFSEKILPALCYTPALEILNWHKSRNHRILILTASSNIWLSRWCEINGFSLLCTEFESKDGSYTGRIKGVNCYGVQKKILLEKYLIDHEIDYSFGYGDSSADKHFIALTDKGYLMKLNSENKQKYWIEIDSFPKSTVI